MLPNEDPAAVGRRACLYAPLVPRSIVCALSKPWSGPRRHGAARRDAMGWPRQGISEIGPFPTLSSQARIAPLPGPHPRRSADSNPLSLLRPTHPTRAAGWPGGLRRPSAPSPPARRSRRSRRPGRPGRPGRDRLTHVFTERTACYEFYGSQLSRRFPPRVPRPARGSLLPKRREIFTFSYYEGRSYARDDRRSEGRSRARAQARAARQSPPVSFLLFPTPFSWSAVRWARGNAPPDSI